ncbi:hypothetical protein ILUMI_18214 [Ignelater luminosus]|uniref:Uncharacterized protein n=1 Tax=Ignelater luminosus TaxID=2038154 RepID=A0A8K0CKB2_IGNLU|nr:hypothetical protein ILUMI_18214 [Ignelater luminosus]
MPEELEKLLQVDPVEVDELVPQLEILLSIFDDYQLLKLELQDELVQNDEELELQVQSDDFIRIKKAVVAIKRRCRKLAKEDNSSSDSGSRRDVRGWLAFWAAFQDIHEDKRLSEAEKYQYLVQCMISESEAHKVVMSYPVSGDNYESAVKDLKRRFGHDNMLIKVYVRDILYLVIRNAQKEIMDFVDLVTSITSQIRNLEKLGVTTDKCAQVLHPIIESCLPEEVLKAWQRSNNYSDTIDKLMEFLVGEVDAMKERDLAYSRFAREKNKPLSHDTKRGKKRDEVRLYQGS